MHSASLSSIFYYSAYHHITFFIFITIIFVYELILESISNVGTLEHYRGFDRKCQVTGLIPFTYYTFYVSVCNNAGCEKSANFTVSTRAAAPDSQPAPYVTPLPGGKVVFVHWDPPAQPNGRIQFYDLYYHPVPKIGGDIVFNTLNTANRNYTVTSLKPYTLYEFRVICYTAQVKGSTASNWTTVRTLEGGKSCVSGGVVL